MTDYAHIVNPNPTQDFSGELLKALEQELFVEGWEEEWNNAYKRAELVEWLLTNEWLLILDEDSSTEWAHAHQDLGFAAVLDSQGEDYFVEATDKLLRSRPKEVVRISAQLLNQLMSEALLPNASSPECREVAFSASDVVREWMSLFVDDEKLAGHLFRVHGCRIADLNGPDFVLMQLHRQAHAMTW